MTYILGLSLIAIGSLVFVLLRSQDRELETIGKHVVVYLVALPSFLFGVLILFFYWP